MKIQPIAGMLLTVALAACHPAAPSANQSATNVVTAANFQQQIEALPAPSRNGVLMRAITDADRDCQTIEKATPHASVDGHPAWSVLCDHGASYVVVIDAGGYAQVIPGKLVPPGETGSNAAS
jgi:hypothetical protein